MVWVCIRNVSQMYVSGKGGGENLGVSLACSTVVVVVLLLLLYQEKHPGSSPYKLVAVYSRETPWVFECTESQTHLSNMGLGTRLG